MYRIEYSNGSFFLSDIRIKYTTYLENRSITTKYNAGRRISTHTSRAPV